MWLFTERGNFYAAVQDRDNHDLIRVRTRTRGDMQVTGFAFTHTPENDYSFLAVVARDRWTAFVADAASNIDYDSLKATVTDEARHAVMVDIWPGTPAPLSDRLGSLRLGGAVAGSGASARALAARFNPRV